ncbi:50S ribosomal protein L20 [Candidatus Woesebacteria bacterium]|nr:50S ribosomal protein L20 [Candidatus Woesebacteria bacterium]
MRVKSITARKHRKIKKLAKGFGQARRKRVKAAKEALVHAGAYAYHGRKLRKRDLRALWITRINAATRAEGMSYSRFMANLKKANIEIDRKILADIAVNDPATFKAILSQVQ